MDLLRRWLRDSALADATAKFERVDDARRTQPQRLDEFGLRIDNLSPRIDALQGQEMARAAERRRGLELRKIDAALARIDAGDYGWCVRCGEEIAAARLRLDPAVPVCIDCAHGTPAT